ncbi:MAG: thioredoxin family protein [Deltaproteobacteria bacterium]|nr:thioredoxin family protein [Deltaproteobacteria bacterium]
MTTEQPKRTPQNLNDLIASEDAVLAYFSTPECRVCKALKPKVLAMLSDEFPKVSFQYVDCEAEPEVAAQNMVFAVPTLVVYFAGRETTRLSRNVGMGELAEGIRRPYQMLFEG